MSLCIKCTYIRDRLRVDSIYNTLVCIIFIISIVQYQVIFYQSIYFILVHISIRARSMHTIVIILFTHTHTYIYIHKYIYIYIYYNVTVYIYTYVYYLIYICIIIRIHSRNFIVLELIRLISSGGQKFDLNLPQKSRI